MKVVVVGFLVGLLALATSVNGAALDEDYGYVDVRSGAHMFWVVYHTELAGNWSDHPLIMWLQGGPGASGVGYGNFEELGPYDINGNLRDGRWTKEANVMFVDNPVGTGYSYVDSLDLLCQDNQQIADDLVTFLISVFSAYPEMQVMPFFVFAESYGGKMTVDFAIALQKAIDRGDITCDFKGVALGDSWISPMDSVNTWGPFLYSMGYVNQEGQANIDNAAASTQNAVDAGNWNMATNLWSYTELVVLQETNGVDFYNVLATENIYVKELSEEEKKKFHFSSPEIEQLFVQHVLWQNRDALGDYMNGAQADAWGIPSTVVWGGQSGDVFNYLAGDFMKPVITSVENLLTNYSIHVAVYTGDLDLICDTPGTYRWIENMNYPQKTDFEAQTRTPLYVSTYSNTAAFVQVDSATRFSVFTLLRSGHMSPIDVPQMALNMVDMVITYGETAVPSSATKVKKEAAEKIQVAKDAVQKDSIMKEVAEAIREAKEAVEQKHKKDAKEKMRKREAKEEEHKEGKHREEKHREEKKHKKDAAVEVIESHHEKKEAKRKAAIELAKKHHHEKEAHKKTVAKAVKSKIEKTEPKVEETHPKETHHEKLTKPVKSVRPSPHEADLRARIAHSHLSKATPFGQKYDKGSIFHPKKPEISV